MPNRKKRPTSASPRAIAACGRACEAYDHLAELAESMAMEIDQITMPGVPIEVDPEESLVTHVESMLAAAKG